MIFSSVTVKKTTNMMVGLPSLSTSSRESLNPHSKNDKIILASDTSWYYNLDHLLSVPLVIDPEAYVKALKRMKTLVSDPDLIVPGHDDLVFSKYPKVADWIVKIEKK